MNRTIAIIAKRYAQAFINIFFDKIDRQDYENIHQAATGINKQVLFFLRLPALDFTVKKDALLLLCKRFSLPPS
ncbi:MAG: hypothetical protein WCD44_00105, partial [Candidatus Babeliales bacterium]